MLSLKKEKYLRSSMYFVVLYKGELNIAGHEHRGKNDRLEINTIYSKRLYRRRKAYRLQRKRKRLEKSSIWGS